MENQIINTKNALEILLEKFAKIQFTDIEIIPTVKYVENALLKNNELILKSKDLNKITFMKSYFKDVTNKAYTMLGFYYGKTHNYNKSIFWLNKLSDDIVDFKLFRDILFPIIINDKKEEKQIIKNLLNKFNNYLNIEDMSSIRNISIMNNSFWYAYIDNNPKELYEKYALIQQKIYKYISKNLFLDYNSNISNYRPLSSSKIKLGIFSAGLLSKEDLIMDFNKVHASSISDSFYPTLLDLDKDKFELIFIYYGKNKNPAYSSNTNDMYIPKHGGNINDLIKWQKKILDLNLDILLYLDLHIEQELNLFAQKRLAKIQVNTHGHPVTSGIQRDIMNYFISWEAAELENAQNHYTEELILIPKNIMWEKFIPRNKEGRSMLTNKSWKNITRDYFKKELKDINIESNWYFCSQATFKLNYNFDSIIVNIMKKDSNAEIILISVDAELYEMKNLFIKRLKNKNIDFNRIHFINKMSHDVMMGMYNVIDVALDSFFFGGDTTTREAFEIGVPVVTLPHKYLGCRWTYAYYNHIGVLDLIAKDQADYVNIAVKIATNKDYRSEISKKIKENSIKLFNSKDAGKAWGHALEQMYNKLPIQENKKEKIENQNQILRVKLVDSPYTEFLVNKEHLQEISSEDNSVYEIGENATNNGIDLSEKIEKKDLKGATELMRDRISDILEMYDDKFNVITNIYNQKDTVDPKKQNIYWCKDNESDPLYKYVTVKDIFVFVTEHQRRNFIEYYSLNPSRCHIIKNALTPIEKHTKPNPNEVCRLIYMSTPHRGLDILVNVFEKLCPFIECNMNIKVHLDIYSSFERCGRKDLDNSEYFKSLYKQIIDNPNMTYHGSVNHDKIITALKQTHIFAYPSTFKETSCLCLIEAMSAGCICVHSSLGALPDTSNGLTYMYDYTPDQMKHCTNFANKLLEAIKFVKTKSLEDDISIQKQMKYVEKEHNIINIRNQWSDLLKSYSENI